MSSKTRPTLLERLRDGTDPLAWDEFFDSYWPMVHAYARHQGCSDQTAEEVVQEVMLKVFQKKDVFKYDPKRGRFRDWLGMLVRNQVVDCRRRPSERVRGRGGESNGFNVKPDAGDPSPDEVWEAAFENALLMVILDTVRQETDPRDFVAFELTMLHELSPARTATVLGISRPSVYRARRRVLGRLRQLGGTYDEDGRLNERIKRALQSRPNAVVERSLTTRVERTKRWK